MAMNNTVDARAGNGGTDADVAKLHQILEDAQLVALRQLKPANPDTLFDVEGFKVERNRKGDIRVALRVALVFPAGRRPTKY